MTSASLQAAEKSRLGAFVGGTGIGVLGGLIGLGGAEFRLPLLIGAFRFAALEAVIVNKAMSLIVVASALAVPGGDGAVREPSPATGRSSSTCSPAA